MRTAAGPLAREVASLPDRRASASPDGLVTIASPLPYLFAEEHHVDRQAREALFLTFNADLGFFERTILGVTQATGARITVIGDGRMSAPDPRAARNAGTSYLHGLAVTPAGAAFHPKITVVVGPLRAVAAIGSGNLTIGGWHLNHETWTVATADRDRCPAIIVQLAEWLRTLPSVCTITPEAAQGIQRTATCLDQLAAESSIIDTGHQLVHTSARPIIDQLPRRELSHLLLYAPFHDEHGEAIGQLIEQMAPAEVRLAVQSDRRTVIQPQAIARVIAELAVPLKVIQDEGPAYRHGKLIEGVSSDGIRWALTGSPNLSGSALLRDVGHGGNIEVGVIAPLSATLFPAGTPTTLDSVPARRIDRTAAERPEHGVLLIGAARSDSDLRVTFARPTDYLVRILVSSHTQFDTWTMTGTVPAGVAEHSFPDANVPAGSRICAEWDTASGTSRSAVIFVSDLELVLRRRGESTGGERAAPPDPMKLITDPRLLEIWAASIMQITSTRASTAVPRVTGSGAPSGERDAPRHGTGLRTDSDDDNWLAYVDDAAARLGPAVVRFALGGLRALRDQAQAAGTGLLEPTDRIIEDSQPGFDADDASTFGRDPGTSAAGADESETADGDPGDAQLGTGQPDADARIPAQLVI